MTTLTSHASRPTVAVFGAAGHTGRFVVQELLRRSIVPVAVGRDDAALTAAFPGNDVLRRQARLDDPASLDHAFAGTHAVINCAGPFLETADAVAAAALRARIHYLDVSAEQASTTALLDRYDTAARAAGIVVLPSMGFYGGFADLLVTAALTQPPGGQQQADTIDILIGLDSWHPTRGTRITGQRNTAPRQVVAGGRLTPASTPAAEKRWDFGDPLGHHSVVEVPFSEIILIARHVATTELHTYLSRIALDDIRNPATPAPTADPTGRSPQRFTVQAVVTRNGNTRRITARGRDIYAFSAPLVCEAVERLLDGNFRVAGALPPGAIFDAQQFLSALTPNHLTLEIATL
jgi:short subunit dehydrogenase-like uncharacterized protein